jgi:hypothetical protein
MKIVRLLFLFFLRRIASIAKKRNSNRLASLVKKPAPSRKFGRTSMVHKTKWGFDALPKVWSRK